MDDGIAELDDFAQSPTTEADEVIQSQETKRRKMSDTIDTEKRVTDPHSANDRKSAKRNAVETAANILARLKASVKQYREKDMAANDAQHCEEWDSVSAEIDTLIEILNPNVRRRRPLNEIACCLVYKRVQIAQGIWRPDGKLLVLAGSDALPVCVPKSGNLGYIPERRKREDEGIIQKGKFVQEYLFPSVASAAAVVLGRSAADGARFWRQKDGSFLY